MLLRLLVLLKILIRHSICDETKRINRNSSLFGNCRMFWPRSIDLQNFILLVRTVSFFMKIIFISSYTEKNNYFLLYELIQDLPYLCVYTTITDSDVPRIRHSNKYFSNLQHLGKIGDMKGELLIWKFYTPALIM